MRAVASVNLSDQTPARGVNLAATFLQGIGLRPPWTRCFWIVRWRTPFSFLGGSDQRVLGLWYLTALRWSLHLHAGRGSSRRDLP